jgi:hypothetical protein
MIKVYQQLKQMTIWLKMGKMILPVTVPGVKRFPLSFRRNGCLPLRQNRLMTIPSTAASLAFCLSKRLLSLAEGEKSYPYGAQGIQHACARHFVADA